MQSERVTFLTSPDHKAALDAFAASNGQSVGHVLREASTRYLAGNHPDDETALALLTREVEDAIPRMRSDLRDAIAAIDKANDAIDAILAGETAKA